VRGIYINWGLIFALSVIISVGTFLSVSFVFPVFQASSTFILVALILASLLPAVNFSRLAPFVFLVNEGRNIAFFIGLPWFFKIELNEIEGVIIRNYGVWILPKEKQSLRWMVSADSDLTENYKMLQFWTLKGWGGLIEFFAPLISEFDVNWDGLKEKEKSYILKKIGELEEKGNGSF